MFLKGIDAVELYEIKDKIDKLFEIAVIVTIFGCATLLGFFSIFFLWKFFF